MFAATKLGAQLSQAHLSCATQCHKPRPVHLNTSCSIPPKRSSSKRIAKLPNQNKRKSKVPSKAGNNLLNSRIWVQAGTSDLDGLSDEETIEVKPLKGKVNVSVERAFTIDVEEGEKSLGEYVTLPAKRYSVLDSEAVQKIGGNRFRVSAGMQKFMLGQSGEPIGIIEIEVGDGFVTQKLLGAEIVNAKGSMMKEMNNVLGNLCMTNTVSAQTSEETESPQIACKVGIEAGFSTGVMSRAPEGTLNGLVGRALGVVLPWFLTKLAEDYVLWASGNEKSRGQLGKGEMQEISKGMLNTLKSGALPDGVSELKLE